MSRRATPRPAIAPGVGALISIALASPAALGQACPAPTDIMYSVKDGDTLSEVAARTYCVTKVMDIHHAWMALHIYNEIPVGGNPHKIYSSTGICFPERLQHGTWSGTRCASPDQGAASGAALSSPGAGSGQSTGPTTCEPAVVCKEPKCCEPSTVIVFEMLPTPAAQRGGEEAKKKPWNIKVSAELVAGAAVPLVGATYDSIHRFIFVGGVGARFNIEGFDLAPRLLFAVGQHGTIFNRVEQQQHVLGGGLAVQGGIPFEAGDFRLTPGLEAGLLYIRREIDRIDYPFIGQVESQSGFIPFVGLFFRPEYVFQSAKRVSVSLDVSTDLILASLAGNHVLENFNARLLGGVSYAF